MDHLDKLRVFIAVADRRGFAPAARALSLSAPAVTRAIAALEQRLGAQLFKRSTRSVHLTEIGERFLDDCRRIVAELAEAEAAVGGAHAVPHGELAITASSMFGRLHVAPIALDFLALHPQVTIHGLFVDRVVHLMDEGFDVAVRIARLPDSGLTAVRVGSMRAVVVGSPAYLAERGVPKHPADLADHDATGFSQTGRLAPRWALASAAASAEPRIRMVTNAGEVAIDAAVRGQGLARAMHYQVDADVRAGRLNIVLAEFEPQPIPVHLVHVAGRKAPAKLRAFVDFAAERLRAEPVLSATPR
ncbi:MAG: LysR family transcriptional regulator [Burkholderiales bacterium]